MKLKTFLTLAVALALTAALPAQCPNPAENFDSIVGPGVGVFPLDWVDGGGTDVWRSDIGGTSSTNTGPSVDHTTGTSTGTYLYCETSLSSGLHTFILHPPVMDNTACPTPTIDFWYHMFGATMGSLDVQELGACGWVTLLTIGPGDQGNSWQFASVGLSSSSSSIIRFFYTRGSSFTGDCTIDDVSLSGTPTGPYVPGGTGSNLWQVNSPEASLTFDGVQGTSTDGAFVTTQIVLDPVGGVCNEGTTTMDFSGSGANGAYEIAFNGAPLVCAGNGAFSIGPGLQLNLDITAGLGFMNGGLAPAVVPYPTAFPGSGTGYSFFVTLAFQAPTTVSVQAVTVDGTGLHLSQATSITATTTQAGLTALCPATVGGDLSPLSDDGAVNVALAVGGFTFYGVNYTDVFVNMNGNLTFGAANSDFAPTETDFLNDEPRIAPAFADWTPDDPAQGTVRAADDGNTLAIEWFDVRAFNCGGGIDSDTFCVTLTYATNDIAMEWGFMGLCGGTVLDTIVGISSGGMLSTPFNVDLTAGPNPNPSATGAIYEDFSQAAFGTFDLGAPGCGGVPGASIDFVSFAGTGSGPYIQN